MNNESAYGQKEMDQYLDEVFTNAYSKVPEDDPPEDVLRKALYHIGMELNPKTKDPRDAYRFVQAYLSGGEFSG